MDRMLSRIPRCRHTTDEKEKTGQSDRKSEKSCHPLVLSVPKKNGFGCKGERVFERFICK